MYLALKPGARCGWAAWSPGEARPICGSFDLPIEQGIGLVGCRTHAWLSELRSVHPFEVLAYEHPTPPTDVLGDKHLAAVSMAIAIGSHIESYCEHFRIKRQRVGLGSWRRTFLGKGVGEVTKTMDRWMRARLDELGWFRPRKREEKEACGILDHLIALEGRHTPPWREKPFTDLQKAAARGER